ETNEHDLDNSGGRTPVVGVYRWIDKVDWVQIFRYPNRFLLEFEVPEPGAYRRWVAEQTQCKGITTVNPDPFTTDGNPLSAQHALLTSDYISAGNYFKIGAR